MAAKMPKACSNVRAGFQPVEGSEGSVMECFITGTEPNTYDGEAARPGPAE